MARTREGSNGARLQTWFVRDRSLITGWDGVTKMGNRGSESLLCPHFSGQGIQSFAPPFERIRHPFSMATTSSAYVKIKPNPVVHPCPPAWLKPVPTPFFVGGETLLLFCSLSHPLTLHVINEAKAWFPSHAFRLKGGSHCQLLDIRKHCLKLQRLLLVLKLSTGSICFNQKT